MEQDHGADPAFVASQSSQEVVSTKGFNRGEGETIQRMARIIALHGLGTINGKNRCGPPNEKWTADEWRERILCCIPSEAEYRCIALAEELYELATQSTEDETQ